MQKDPKKFEHLSHKDAVEFQEKQRRDAQAEHQKFIDAVNRRGKRKTTETTEMRG